MLAPSRSIGSASSPSAGLRRNVTTRLAGKAEASERLAVDEPAQVVGRPDDRAKAVAEFGLHRLLGAPFERRRRRRTRVEHDVAARQERANVGEPGRFERRLERRHARVHRAHAAEEGDVAWHRT